MNFMPLEDTPTAYFNSLHDVNSDARNCEVEVTLTAFYIQ